MWKKKSIDIAINYYKKALELDPKNKTALRSLSMIIRSNEAQSIEEKQKIAQESLDYAKKAISLKLNIKISI